MIKLDLQNTEDLARVGFLLSNDIYPTQGTNYITADGKREHFAFFPDKAKPYLKNSENTKEYKAAYLMAVFIEEARKEVPLVVHKLPNDKEILIPADINREELRNILSRI